MYECGELQTERVCIHPKYGFFYIANRVIVMVMMTSYELGYTRSAVLLTIDGFPGLSRETERLTYPYA